MWSSERWCLLQELVTFQAKDRQGSPVYHTNVVMAVGTDVAVVCLESVTDEAERRRLKDSLASHHEASSSTIFTDCTAYSKEIIAAWACGRSHRRCADARLPHKLGGFMRKAAQLHLLDPSYNAQLALFDGH